MRAAFLRPALVAVALAAAPRVAAAEDGRAFVVEAGRFNVLRRGAPTQQAGLAYRRPLRRGFEAEAGAVVASSSAYFLHLALARDIPIGGPFVLRPALGAGAYHEGAGKTLGSILQFRSALELSVRLTSGPRIGLALYHLSNANLWRHNPGEESLVLTCAVPARWAAAVSRATRKGTFTR